MGLSMPQKSCPPPENQASAWWRAARTGVTFGSASVPPPSGAAGPSPGYDSRRGDHLGARHAQIRMPVTSGKPRRCRDASPPSARTLAGAARTRVTSRAGVRAAPFRRSGALTGLPLGRRGPLGKPQRCPNTLSLSAYTLTGAARTQASFGPASVLPPSGAAEPSPGCHPGVRGHHRGFGGHLGAGHAQGRAPKIPGETLRYSQILPPSACAVTGAARTRVTSGLTSAPPPQPALYASGRGSGGTASNPKHVSTDEKDVEVGA